jgi:hypothetical protein
MSGQSNDSDYASLERLRERVIEQLSSGYSQDLLSEGEFDERMQGANSAESHAELRQLIGDLPISPTSGSLAPGVESSPFPVNDGPVEAESSLVAVFSGTERKGVWDPPKTLNVVAFFGGSDIDLREAHMPPDGMTIRVAAVFGGVDIIVPEGFNVKMGGAGIFGAFESKRRRSRTIPGAPTVKVDGVALFGGVEVKFK